MISGREIKQSLDRKIMGSNYVYIKAFRVFYFEYKMIDNLMVIVNDNSVQPKFKRLRKIRLCMSIQHEFFTITQITLSEDAI